MSTSIFDEQMHRVTAGERLSDADIVQLAASPDILRLGMLADAVRRRLHGTRVTYLRVSDCPFDQSFADAVVPTALEVRITGSPETLELALTSVEIARAVAGERTVSGLSWLDVERFAGTSRAPVTQVLGRLRAAGLDALAEVPMDRSDTLGSVLEELVHAGYRQVRLTIEKAPAAERTALLLEAAELQERHGCIQAINPLPTLLTAYRPSTGYEDVKMVAIARLAAPNIPHVQVDWRRYGPKLAQVALTFGADDFDGVSASEAAPDGRRRAPLEEMRRNVEAAGFTPAERDGAFNVINS